MDIDNIYLNDDQNDQIVIVEVPGEEMENVVNDSSPVKVRKRREVFNNEETIRAAALSEASILDAVHLLLEKDCPFQRKRTSESGLTKSTVCPNGRKCPKSLRDLKKAILELRQKLFYLPDKNEHGRVVAKKTRKAILDNMLNDWCHDGKIRYSLANCEVCRPMFQVATGFDVKMFDQIEKDVLERHNNLARTNAVYETFLASHAYVGATGVRYVDVASARQAILEQTLDMPEITEQEGNQINDVLAFLDIYFKAEDSDPKEKDKRVTKLSWMEVYAQYVTFHCVRLQCKPVPYNRFCSYRSQFRKNYTRSRKHTSKRGWDHLRCSECDHFVRQINAARKGNESEKLQHLREAFQDHLLRQMEHRDVYYTTRAKAAYNKLNCSFIVDGAGGAGCTYNPRVAVNAKHFVDRHRQMKIKMNVTKVHGHGSYVDIKFNDIEVMGTNLTVEMIMQNVYTYMDTNGLQQLRNVYVQLDNVNSNKGWLVVVSMAVLVATGIVKKVKLSYLLVGHTHEDIDALISVIASYLRKIDVWSLEELADAIKRAVSKEGSKILDVFIAYGVPDYDSAIGETAGLVQISHRLPLTKMRTIRLSAHPEACAEPDIRVVDFHYTDDAAKAGWYPRGIANHMDNSVWAKHFTNLSNPTLAIDCVDPVTIPCIEKGHRQEWIYKVRYVDGTEQDFFVPCEPVKITIRLKETVEAVIRARHQPLYCKSKGVAGPLASAAGREKQFQNIKQLLEAANAPSDQLEKWESFFRDLPEDGHDDFDFKNSMKLLIEKFYNPDTPMQLPTRQIRCTTATYRSNYTCDPIYKANPELTAKRFAELEAASRAVNPLDGVIRSKKGRAVQQKAPKEARPRAVKPPKQPARNKRKQSEESITSSSSSGQSEEEGLDEDDECHEDIDECRSESSREDEPAPQVVIAAPMTEYPAGTHIYARVSSFEWLTICDRYYATEHKHLFAYRDCLYVTGLVDRWKPINRNKVRYADVSFPALNARYELAEAWFEEHALDAMPESATLFTAEHFFDADNEVPTASAATSKKKSKNH